MRTKAVLLFLQAQGMDKDQARHVIRTKYLAFDMNWLEYHRDAWRVYQ